MLPNDAILRFYNTAESYRGDFVNAMEIVEFRPLSDLSYLSSYHRQCYLNDIYHCAVVMSRFPCLLVKLTSAQCTFAS